MNIAVFGRSVSEENANALNQLCEAIYKYHQQDLEVLIYEPFWEEVKNSTTILCQHKLFSNFEHIKNNIDYFFSIGGDGTLLNTLDFLIGTTIPVIGINTGRLGFLAHFKVDQIQDIIDCLFQDKFAEDKRSLLEISSNQETFQTAYALNEFTIQKKDPSAVIKAQVYLNNEFLSSYWADGVILSTPTGSTGYNLSAGGPLIFPTDQSFVITPIAPHNLNLRPITIPDSSIVKICIAEHRGQSYCTIDSKHWAINQEYEFTISKAQYELNILRPKNTNFIDTLRSKLMWGLDNRNL